MMPDREKVIKGVWQCWLPSDEEEYETQCRDCPYYERGITLKECMTALRKDTIELLKEQETEIRQLKLALDIAKGTCKGIVFETDEKFMGDL